MKKIEYKIFDKNAKKPFRAFKEDAGADLVCPRDVTIKAGEQVMIDLGIGFNIPKGTCIKLYSRSSMFKKGLMLHIGVGVIDSGYTGSVKAPMYNNSTKDISIEKGERIVQAVLEPVYTPDFVCVDNLSISDRGNGCFGSSGEK